MAVAIYSSWHRWPQDSVFDVQHAELTLIVSIISVAYKVLVQGKFGKFRAVEDGPDGGRGLAEWLFGSGGLAK